MVTTFRICPPPHTRDPAPATRQPARHRAAILAWALLSLALGQAAKAAPGDLDPSFDADGLVLTHFGRIDDDSQGGRNEFASAVAVQPDGKLLVAGSSQASGGFNLLDFALARYNPDGTLDTSFGSGGRVVTDFPDVDFDFDDASALVVQPDGKPVVAGESSSRFGLARYSRDGSLDAGFGSNGLVRTDFRSDTEDNFDKALALVLQPDGKLVATGSSVLFVEGGFAAEFALARYNPDGTLDTSFGSGGLVLTDFGSGGPFAFDFEEARALVLQPDGKLVAAGEQACGLALARYNPDGSLDSSFGSGGRVSAACDEGSPFGAKALVLLPDGKLVTVGLSARPLDGGPRAFTLSRFKPDGSLDASFGTGGRVIPIFASEDIIPEALLLQPDGKLVVAGATGLDCFIFFDIECPPSDFVLVRHNADGSLDTSFGSDGRVLTNFSGRVDFFTHRAHALGQQPDGKLVAAGISRASGDTDFALARYLVTDERPAAPPPRCGGRRATMLGTPGNDMLRGTFFGRDVILGLRGNDTIRGFGGDDILCGGPGNDVLIGGDDTDQLHGGTGNDMLFGDRGLSAVDGNDSLYGGPGRDTLVADDGADLLFGEGGNDRLLGDAGQDSLDGGDGRDRCRDRLGRNTVARCESGRVRRPPEPPRDPPPSNPSACPPVSSSPNCTGN